MVEPKNGRPGSRETTLRTATAAEPFHGFDRPFARISWGDATGLTLIGTAVGLATLKPRDRSES